MSDSGDVTSASGRGVVIVRLTYAVAVEMREELASGAA